MPNPCRVFHVGHMTDTGQHDHPPVLSIARVSSAATLAGSPGRARRPARGTAPSPGSAGLACREEPRPAPAVQRHRDLEAMGSSRQTEPILPPAPAGGKTVGDQPRQDRSSELADFDPPAQEHPRFDHRFPPLRRRRRASKRGSGFLRVPDAARQAPARPILRAIVPRRARAPPRSLRATTPRRPAMSAVEYGPSARSLCPASLASIASARYLDPKCRWVRLKAL